MKQVAARPYVLAAAALAATSLVAVTPTASRVASGSAQRAVHSIETSLVDSSIFNIPFNLLQEIVNIPNSEIGAIDYLSQSLFNSGPWFVVSATNLWGVDPGDPSKFIGGLGVLLPFPGLNGINEGMTDFNAGLGQQYWGLVATTLPTSGGCDATDCLPYTPTSPVTGINGIDSFIRLNDILTGRQEFPLFDNWFKTGLDDIFPSEGGGPSDFVFPDEWTTAPSGQVYEIFPNLPGTTLDPETGEYMYPWAGDNFTFQPWVPFQNWIEGLMEDPDYTGGGFEFPSFDEIGRTLQSFTASLAMFTPFTPGSPFCPGECEFVTDNNLDYPDLIRYIDQAWPGNDNITTWLEAYDNGVANVPTEEQIENSIRLLQQGFWSFGNPQPPAGSGPDYTQTVADFRAFWESLGFDPDNNPAPGDFAGQFAAFANAFSPEQLTENWENLAAAFTPEALTESYQNLIEAFSPEALADLWAPLLEAFNPAEVAADAGAAMDWTALLAGFGL
ncbi:hypothetical protein PT015_10775 [Candidatus Mycobacterium wuenschmannii]|uniref:PE-PPE domain-containing protein n=1 Tax=Candidatus Mycobacterium wuenschmannii TaxID=3027808 RepID=A0ABY8W3U7_9MYCO|nr:hypothetical protein [Candidatus Mycobacterium wuenschmannii]WIM89860.1 hypothetical protein PT015_10775 [Candidatus Mycobacterium wuenschmannii]